MRLACRLRLIRSERELSIRQAEIKTGISRGALSEIEHGRRLPTDDQASEIERVYGEPRDGWYHFGGLEPVIHGDSEAAA